LETRSERPSNEQQTFYVDIPTEDCTNDDSGAWHNVGEFATETETLAFATEHFGADTRGRVFLVPSQMDERQDKVEMAAREVITVLEAEPGALRIWQAAKALAGGLPLPDDVWDDMSISIGKIETVLRQAGVDDPSQAGK